MTRDTLSSGDRRLTAQLTREFWYSNAVAARTERVAARAAARAHRRLRRARRQLPGQVAVTAVSAGAFGLGLGDTWAVLAVGAGLLAVRSVRRLVWPEPVVADGVPGPRRSPLAAGWNLTAPSAGRWAPRLAAGRWAPRLAAGRWAPRLAAGGWAPRLAAGGRLPPPPPPGSAAFPAVRQLAAARSAVLRLLPLVAPAGRDVAEEAARVAGDHDRELRWQAHRLAAVEPHRGADRELLRLLADGVVAQQALVAGLADLVAASAGPYPDARLRDATDALHGLASGLRTVRTLV